MQKTFIVILYNTTSIFNTFLANLCFICNELLNIIDELSENDE